MHQLLAGVVYARQQRYDTAARTILRGIRHAGDRLKEPLQSATPWSTLQRRAIAITLLEALINLGPVLDTMTLRAAYDHCRTTLTNNFQGLTLKQITGGRILTASEQHRCGALLQTVKLTNSEEVRDARTIHQAKGSERQNVFVSLTGRDEAETQEHINHILYPAEISNEQQRVTYVAISRARDRLFIQAPTLTAAQEERAQELGIAIDRVGTV